MERLYNLKIISSGNRIEIYKMNHYAARADFKKASDEVEEPKEMQQEHKLQTIKDRKATLNKARNNIVRLIKSNPDMTTFITLTFKEVPDYKESKKLLNVFFTKLRKKYSNLKYIWVLELGEKNKRLHYHLLTNIKVPIKLSSSKEEKTDIHKDYEKKFRQNYWNHGFIDVRSLKQEDNTNIALYVSCYIVKSLLEIKIDGRVYGYSYKTMDKPIETKIYSNQNIEELLKIFNEYDLDYTNSYNIGFTAYDGTRSGTVTYLDLTRNKVEGDFYNEN